MIKSLLNKHIVKALHKRKEPGLVNGGQQKDGIDRQRQKRRK